MSRTSIHPESSDFAVKVWLKGETPHDLQIVDMRKFREDFVLDAENIRPDQIIEFSGLTVVPGYGGDRPSFTFRGADKVLHLVSIDLDLFQVAGLDEKAPENDEVGVFVPDTGEPIEFGGPGQPALDEILSGRYIPDQALIPICPDGTYQVIGDPMDFAVRDLAFQPSGADDFPSKGGLVSCLAVGSKVITKEREIEVEQLLPGEQALTFDHGFQPVDWVKTQSSTSTRRFVHVATAKGVLKSPNAATARFLVLSSRFRSTSTYR